MGWENPPRPWREVEAKLSDRPRTRPFPVDGDGGDSPAWSHKRPVYRPPADLPRGSAETVSYAELHCHSNFSFLDGSSHPEELVEEAVRLGLAALALTDHDGMYGVVRFSQAAAAAGLPTVFGAELTLGLDCPQNGVADPTGTHVLVLARDPVGYTRLCRALSVAHLGGGQKGRPFIDVATLAALGAGLVPDLGHLADAHDHAATPGEWRGVTTSHSDHWVILTGCRKGPVPRALMEAGPARAGAQLARLQQLFGRDNVVVELWDHGHPLDSARNDALVAVADHRGAEVVATNNVHYHVPARRRLAAALSAVRARRSLDDMDGWLPAAGSAHLRSGMEQARRFDRYPGVVARAGALGLACAFDLALVAPRLPPWPTPEGHSEASWLRHLTEEGGRRRYGPRHAPSHPRAWAQIDYELDLIEQLGFPGYFLIVWDIVEYCRTNDIYCQGRGSAANSAVCYALGITNADAVGLGLLFERFLSTERDGPPDIDVDIESGRREEAIQYVYHRYGRDCAAQVANVVTYRPRSAVRDMGKALGAAPGQLDAWAKQIDGWGPLSATAAAGDHDIPAAVMDLAAAVQHFPRHLGIHSGGMVICDRPVAEVCPVEWARMADRSVLQWDKDDCAAVGLVKFDMLGLGMLTVLHATIDHIAAAHGVSVDLACLPQDDAVYEMLCQADSVGVFQVESRAQMATLPRLKPRCFYDLVVEVALIRPGPIQGGSVHPYIRRRNGTEPVTFLHPLLERSLAKTLGVPLFQEQLMQMAIDVAGFSAADADQLRQAMGSKRSVERMQRLRGRLFDGMAERGITGDVAEQIYEKLVAFANFGFPESHSVSFAYLVYASAWMKLHYPAAFCAGLLDGQPMGFWSPQTIVADARRHGVEVRGPDVNHSEALSCLEADDVETGPAIRGGPSPAVRLGVSSVRHLGTEPAERIAAGRPYRDVEDVVRRCGITVAQAEALATAGAFGGFGLSRRQALWSAGALAAAGGSLEAGSDPAGSGRSPKRAHLPGLVTGAVAPRLPGMDPVESNRADLWALGLSPDSYPTELIREELTAAGVVTSAGLIDVAHGARVAVAGVVTHRQRPATAQGVVFINLEDETGLINVICWQRVWVRFRRVARSQPALRIDGRLERVEGVVNIVAERITALALRSSALKSRDFR
ncbi:MAG: error-prone DNA polymerase [Actinomycetota bacterium]|nr:error-prone DNA polymerase [Actinomycetota bacterium]